MTALFRDIEFSIATVYQLLEDLFLYHCYLYDELICKSGVSNVAMSLFLNERSVRKMVKLYRYTFLKALCWLTKQWPALTLAHPHVWWWRLTVMSVSKEWVNMKKCSKHTENTFPGPFHDWRVGLVGQGIFWVAERQLKSVSMGSWLIMLMKYCKVTVIPRP